MGTFTWIQADLLRQFKAHPTFPTALIEQKGGHRSVLSQAIAHVLNWAWATHPLRQSIGVTAIARVRCVGLVLALLLFPAGVCSEPRTVTADSMVIEKANRTLKLFRGTQLLKEYSVALGRTPEGAKECQGDGKTPEGVYTIVGRNRASAFHRSLRVSYPETRDRLHATTLGCDPGGDIMIHGLPNGQGFIGSAHRLYDWTEGCVAVTDSEIEEIWSLVPNGMSVTIKP